MLCRKDVSHLVPSVLKVQYETEDVPHVIRYYPMINDNEYYLAMLGARLRRQIIQARIRRLRDDLEVPLLVSEEDVQDEEVQG